MAESRGVTGGVNLPGMLAFLDAYLAAPDDADITIRLGVTNAGQMVLVVTLDETAAVGMTSAQARGFADALDDTLRAFPSDPGARGLPNLILGLRAGADKLDKEPTDG